MADRQDTGGLSAALALLGARGGLVDGEGNQVDLFENEAAPLPLPVKGLSGPQGGRPAGARNRSTEEWARMLLGRYRSPLTVLAELYSQPLPELVDALQEMADKHKKWRETKYGGYFSVVQVDPLHVLKLQRDAAVALAPYLHKQQPKDVTVTERPRGLVVLGALEACEDVSDELALPLPKDEQNQGIGDGAAAKSDDRGR